MESTIVLQKSAAKGVSTTYTSIEKGLHGYLGGFYKLYLDTTCGRRDGLEETFDKQFLQKLKSRPTSDVRAEYLKLTALIEDPESHLNKIIGGRKDY